MGEVRARKRLKIGWWLLVVKEWGELVVMCRKSRLCWCVGQVEIGKYGDSWAGGM